MIATIESCVRKAEQEFQEILEWLASPAAATSRIDQVERKLFSLLLALGLSLLKLWVARRGTGDQGATLTAEGTTWRRLPELHTRRYVSVFGELTMARCVYGTREGQKIERVPFDADLGLPASEYSSVLQDWLQRLCVKESFDEATVSLQTLLGLKPSGRTAEQLNRALAEHADAFRHEQPVPPSAAEGDVLVFTADAKGVPMCPKDRPPVKPKGKAADEPRRGCKRMAYVGAVYSIAPFPRTVEQVTDEVARQERATERPPPQHKQVWAEMTRTVQDERCLGRTTLFGEMAAALQQRDPSHRKPWICLFDGEKNLWRELRRCLRGTVAGTVVGILDLWHVLTYLWKAAQVFHSKASPAAQAYVDEHLRLLLQGKVGRVIGEWREQLQQGKLRGQRRQTLQQALTYFENNRAHMKYHQYLAAGYPIGSGVAEGACRHLVKDRLEGTGMHWRIDGAQAMLSTRAIYLNGDWDAFIEFRVQQEQKALYGLAL